jgi:hypothetical protein
MNQNVHEYCQTCDQCQRTSHLLMQNLTKLVTTSPKNPNFKNGDWISLDLLNIQANCQATSTSWWPLTMQPSGWKHEHLTPTLL